MLIKLKEAQKIDSSKIDEHGRLVSSSSFVVRELLVNPEHVVSINEEFSRTGEKMSRVETTRGVFTVLGTPNEIQEQLTGDAKAPSRSKKVLKD